MVKESSYYHVIRSYLENLGYFCGEPKKGLGTLGVHADIIGVKDVSHEYSAEEQGKYRYTFFEIPELAAVEVKTWADSKVLTEAARLAIYAHYCYFALAEGEYQQRDFELAESLGVGLLQIKGSPRTANVVQLREAGRKSPREDFVLRLLYSSFNYARCAICRGFTPMETGLTYWVTRRSEWRRDRYISVSICAACLEAFRRILVEGGTVASVNYRVVRRKIREGAKKLELEFSH